MLLPWRDTQADTLSLVSSDESGIPFSNLYSDGPVIDVEGRYIAFQSRVTGLPTGDPNGYSKVYVKDLQSGAISVFDPEDAPALNHRTVGSISAGGRFVTFQVNSDPAQVFSRDTSTNEVFHASTDMNGVAANSGATTPVVSADGRFVVFHSTATNLITGQYITGLNIFRKQTETGEISVVNTNQQGIRASGGSSAWPAISTDARLVAFESYGNNLGPIDTNGLYDIYVKDVVTGEVALASSDKDGNVGNNASRTSVISGDGRYVAFVSWASNLVPGDDNGIQDVFVKDLLTGAIARVSVDIDGIDANAWSSTPSISGDGRYIMFCSAASNLVPGDTNNKEDVFVVENPLESED